MSNLTKENSEVNLYGSIAVCNAEKGLLIIVKIKFIALCESNTFGGVIRVISEHKLYSTSKNQKTIYYYKL